MAKIDTSGIEGYAEMTAEQKLAALEGFDIPDPDLSGYVKKDLFDKKASELAAAKKQLGEKMTEDEQQKAQKEQELKDLQDKVASLEKEKTISAYKAKYLADGYEEKLAEETAKALAEGDSEKVFANQKAFLEAHDKKLKAELMRQNPDAPGGDDGDKKTDDVLLAEKIAKQSVEASKLASEGLKHYL